MARDRFTPAKAPYLEGGRIVDAFFKDIGESMKRAVTEIEKVMTVFANEQERLRRIEAKRIADEAEAKAKQLRDEAAGGCQG